MKVKRIMYFPAVPRGDQGQMQRHAAQACDEHALATHFGNLSRASQTLLLSQAGPHAARAFTVLPTHEDVTSSSAQFRVLLLRRLRLPLPLTPHACRCGGALDALRPPRGMCHRWRPAIEGDPARTRAGTCVPRGRSPRGAECRLG